MKKLLLTTLAILTFAVAQAQTTTTFYQCTVLRICDYDSYGNRLGCKDWDDDTEIEITDDMHYVRRYVNGRIFTYQTYDVKHEDGETTFVFKTRSMSNNGRYMFILDFSDHTLGVFDESDNYTAYLYYWSTMRKL